MIEENKNKEEASKEQDSEDINLDQDSAEELEVDNLVEELEEKSLDNQIKDLEDQVLRAKAEVQNVRRIASQEVTKARLYGVESLAKEFLSVGDDIERAISSCEGNKEVLNIKEGLEMTLKNFEKSLKTSGIEPINCDEGLFDPDKHEAISLIEDDSLEPNSIIEVIQKGYTILDRTLRPSKVIVSKSEKNK
ncbi:MAG TPA: nucleotide exchange factor GrpE [SAR86 cluster bacterium]|nr:nucleotide exchange factor GrpE [SAR86 cluster bacterium]HJM59502.1 nucleotide exchange factor GrpE [SAR86 cluster bacterium]